MSDSLLYNLDCIFIINLLLDWQQLYVGLLIYYFERNTNENKNVPSLQLDYVVSYNYGRNLQLFMITEKC